MSITKIATMKKKIQLRHSHAEKGNNLILNAKMFKGVVTTRNLTKDMVIQTLHNITGKVCF